MHEVFRSARRPASDPASTFDSGVRFALAHTISYADAGHRISNGIDIRDNRPHWTDRGDGFRTGGLFDTTQQMHGACRKDGRPQRHAPRRQIRHAADTDKRGVSDPWAGGGATHAPPAGGRSRPVPHRPSWSAVVGAA